MPSPEHSPTALIVGAPRGLGYGRCAIWTSGEASTDEFVDVRPGIDYLDRFGAAVP